MRLVLLSAFAAASLVSPAAIEVKSAVTNGVEVFWFEEMVPMRDGTRLYTYGVLPKPGETKGIVLERNPYVKEQRVDLPALALREQGALRRGYAYVRQHVRGTGLSEGDWVPYVDERADGLATLAWIRTLPHYRGEIFLQGGSYLSSVHWSYLDTNPPDVKGAVLNIQDLNRYNIHYRNGHYKSALHGNWVVGGYKKKNRALRRDPSVKFTDLPLAGFSVRRLGERVADLEDTWCHPRPTDPWWRTPGTAGGEYRRALLDSTMPVLMISGFYDIYTEGLYDMWRELPAARRANCALVIDAGDHGGRSCVDFPNGFRTSPGAVDSNLDWFDFCRGRKDALKVVKPGETRWYELWGKRWLSAPEMTDGGDTLEIPLAFETTAFTYDPKNPPSFPGSGCLAFGGMKEQPAPGFRPDVISFVTKPFAGEKHVRGRMRLTLAVGTDADDTAFYVRVMIGKGGRWYTLRDDIKSLSWDTPDYRPGATAKIGYLLSDHSFVIGAGDMLRVDVAGANVAQFIPHANYKGEFRLQEKSRPAHSFVDPKGCRLTLPVVRKDR